MRMVFLFLLYKNMLEICYTFFMEEIKKEARLMMFAGITNIYKNASSSVIAVRLEAEEGRRVMNLPPRTISPHRMNEQLTAHYLLLCALRYTVEELAHSKPADVKIHLVFPADNHQIYVEWEEDYKKVGSFTKYTKDQIIWQAIVRVAKPNNITIEITDEDSPLTGINVIENECVRRLTHE